MSEPSNHFKIEEVTPPGFHDWKYLTQELVGTIDEIRDLHNAPVMCNYPAKGTNHRGFREPGCGVGNVHGFHYIGQAADLDLYGLTPDEARAQIRVWKSEGKLIHLGGMELGVNWCHVDVRDPTKFGKPAGTIFEFTA